MEDVFVITYRQGGMRPEIQQPREPVSQWNDKSYSETKKVLEKFSTVTIK